MTRVESLRKWGPFSAATLFFLLGNLLRPLPHDVDTPFHFTVMLGSLCIFGFWWIGIFFGGRALVHAVGLSRPSFGLNLAAGTAAAVILAMVFGHAGLIGYSSRLFWVLALFAGTIGGASVPSEVSRRPPAGNRRRNGMAVLGVCLFAAWFAALFLGASLVQFHTDPLYDHLVAPRLWTDAGRIFFPEYLPFSLKVSYWQYLHIWGNALLGGPGGLGLVEAQLFAQWTHVGIGFLGSAALLENWLRSRVPGTALRYAIVLAAMSSTTLSWTTSLAKDGWGVALWFLAGLEIWFGANRQRTRSAAWLAGAFFGFSIAAKLTTAYPVAGLLVVDFGMSLQARDRKRLATRYAALLGGLFLALSPWLLRNWAFTGNPLFPMMDHVFPSGWISPAQERLLNAYTGVGTPRSWGKTLGEVRVLLTENAGLAALLIAIVAACFRGFRRFDLLYLAPVIGLVPFLYSVGFDPAGSPSLLLRIFGPGILIGSAFGFAALAASLPRRRGVALAAILILLTIGFRQAYWLPSWRNFERNVRMTTESLRAIPPGGLLKAWLRMKTKPGDLIASAGDSQIYYISHLNVTVIADQPELDRRALDLAEGRAIFQMLDSFGVRYLFSTIHSQERYWGPVAFWLDRFIDRHPDTVLFAAPDGYVVSVREVIERTATACETPLPRNFL